MRAHLVQLDIVWEDREANFERVERLLDRARPEPGDLVLLPELFSGGFSLNLDKTADKGGVVRAFLARLADDFGCTVQGGRAVRDCHCTHGTNHMTVWGPPAKRGEDAALLADYAKIHPFSFGREMEAFVGGDEVVLYDWAGPGGERVKTCPAVCYDLRFPELFRIALKRGAECYAIGANWPAARQEHWRALCVARAIENQAFVLAVNRTGNDPHLAYVGGSIAVGPKGEVVGELGEEEGVLSVGIDPAAVRDWRAVFGAWRDMRLM